MNTPEQPDMVNRPPHYTSSDAKCSKCGEQIECIDVVEHASFNLGNVIKYCWRADLKGNALEDLSKAEFYIKREIQRRSKAVG